VADQPLLTFQDPLLWSKDMAIMGAQPLICMAMEVNLAY